MAALGPDFEAEFTRIYDEHAKAVYRHCYFRMLDEHDAQDVMQEAFVRLWTYMASGKTVENYRAFLYTTANRLIIDLARQRKRRPTVSLEMLADEGREFGGPSLEHDIGVREDSRELYATLGKLKEPYRGLLIMRYLDGLTVADIARIIGRSAPVVSVQLHRGIAKLRALLRHE